MRRAGASGRRDCDDVSDEAVGHQVIPAAGDAGVEQPGPADDVQTRAPRVPRVPVHAHPAREHVVTAPGHDVGEGLELLLATGGHLRARDREPNDPAHRLDDRDRIEKPVRLAQPVVVLEQDVGIEPDHPVDASGQLAYPEVDQPLLVPQTVRGSKLQQALVPGQEEGLVVHHDLENERIDPLSAQAASKQVQIPVALEARAEVVHAHQHRDV